MLGPPTTIYSTDTDDIQMNLLTQGHSQLVGEGGGGRGEGRYSRNVSKIFDCVVVLPSKSSSKLRHQSPCHWFY